MSTPADRLGPPPLNRIPWGLLDAFGIKNGGRNPQTLSPVLAPALEMFDWYVGTNAILHGGQAAAAIAANQGISIVPMSGFPQLALTAGGGVQVPEDEWWYLYQANIVINAASTFAGSFRLSLNAITNTNRFQFLFAQASFPAALGVSSEHIETLRSDQGFWIQPGSTIELWSAGIVVTAGTGTPTVDLKILRCRA